MQHGVPSFAVPAMAKSHVCPCLGYNGSYI